MYLHTYRLDPTATTKPAVNARSSNGIKDGRLLINYIGHGSPFQLTDERVLTTADVGNHAQRHPAVGVVAASCDVGKFNDPLVLSLGEALVLNPNGGAVGVISATELRVQQPERRAQRVALRADLPARRDRRVLTSALGRRC